MWGKKDSFKFFAKTIGKKMKKLVSLLFLSLLASQILADEFSILTLPYTPPQMYIKLKDKIHSENSAYQKIEIVDTYILGKMLLLDGAIQTTEKDEFIYHDMICHTPMLYHPNPKKILIIGDGDGGALKTILKHDIEKVWLVEIDKKVIEISKQYMPKVSDGAFENPKAEIVIEDGKKFIKKYENFFDVIILALSDVTGPAKELISIEFYKDINKALKENGVLAIQGGSVFESPITVLTIFNRISEIFKSVFIHTAVIPSYGLSDFCFTIAGKFDLGTVTLDSIKTRYNKLNLNTQYYHPKMHFASRVLPKYLQNNIVLTKIIS
jgi:spermidine synthase